MDANVWAGSSLIPGDPNPQNNNGKLFEEFLRRNPNLTVVNKLMLCEGLITRIRCAKNKIEKSILDFFIVCDKVRSYIEKMIIDETRKHVLTNFNPIRNGGKAIESDHNTQILKLTLQYQKRITERIEIFNFKNLECQEKFHCLTSQTQKLSECFKMDSNFEEQSSKWKKTLDSFCHQSFKKVRLTPNKPEVTKISGFMEERKTLKIMIKMAENKQNVDELQQQLEKLDTKIAKFQKFSMIRNWTSFCIIPIIFTK